MEVTTDPIERFESVLARARQIDPQCVPEPTAFALATSGAGGRPSVRMLLLKDVEDGAFVFYTNFRSRKGRELGVTPFAAMCFHWQPLETQVRIEGPVAPVDPAVADTYFASRPRGSQLGAWASLQSQPIESPGDFQRRLADVEARFAGMSVQRPPHWSGFRLTPERIEFWSGRPDRLHERHLYERKGAAWAISILYP